jgi:hypothetical protein
MDNAMGSWIVAAIVLVGGAFMLALVKFWTGASFSEILFDWNPQQRPPPRNQRISKVRLARAADKSQTIVDLAFKYDEATLAEALLTVADVKPALFAKHDYDWTWSIHKPRLLKPTSQKKEYVSYGNLRPASGRNQQGRYLNRIN